MVHIQRTFLQLSRAGVIIGRSNGQFTRTVLGQCGMTAQLTTAGKGIIIPRGILHMDGSRRQLAHQLHLARSAVHEDDILTGAEGRAVVPVGIRAAPDTAAAVITPHRSSGIIQRTILPHQITKGSAGGSTAALHTHLLRGPGSFRSQAAGRKDAVHPCSPVFVHIQVQAQRSRAHTARQRQGGGLQVAVIQSHRQ